VGANGNAPGRGRPRGAKGTTPTPILISVSLHREDLRLEVARVLVELARALVAPPEGASFDTRRSLLLDLCLDIEDWLADEGGRR
jgi:hypothetical protein